MDGTLLDQATYRWEAAEPALRLCGLLKVPLVLVSSKTRGEIDLIRKDMGIFDPFVSENGGGIFFPVEGSPEAPPGTVLAEGIRKWSLGSAYEFLVKCLREIRDETGLDIRGFSDMPLEKISHLTGLDPETSRLAAEREYDEPFIVEKQRSEDKGILQAAAERRGLSVTSGGRFFHLQGKNDKGVAVGKVISWYEADHAPVFSVALGDSPNDFTMLKEVDQPVLVRSALSYPEIQEEIEGLRVTRETGPKGWNSAVLDILNKTVKGGISGHV